MVTNKLEKLSLRVLDAFDGTPEELGSLLAVATQPPIVRSWYPTEFEDHLYLERHNARVKLMSYDGGTELMLEQERLLRGS